jgi:hypothetical protein
VFVESALSERPGDKELLVLKSLITFRAAEIAHVKGNKAKAGTLYRQCLAIDESIGNTGDEDLINGLLANL